MKNSKIIAVFLGLALSFFLLPSTSQAKGVGYFSALQGRVDLLKPGQFRAVPVNVSQEVFEGDIVRTKSDGRAEITFYDQSIVKIAPNSRLKVTEYLFEGQERKKSTLFLFRGKIRTIVSKSRKILSVIFSRTRNFEVHTPTAVVGVKGTDFFVYHTMGTTGVVVADGLVETENPDLPGSAVNVRAGYATTVTKKKPPHIPRPFSDIELVRHMKYTDIEEPEEEKEHEEGDETGQTQASLEGDDGDEESGGLTEDISDSDSEDDGRDLDDDEARGSDDTAGAETPSYHEGEGFDDDGFDYIAGGDLDDYDTVDFDEDLPSDDIEGDHVEEDLDIIPLSETNPEVLDTDDDDRTLVAKIKGATISGGFTAGGSVSAQNPSDWEWEMYSLKDKEWGEWDTEHAEGSYTQSASGTWDLDVEFIDSSTTAVTYTSGTQWSGGVLSGQTFGYGADLTSASTWISAGTTTGTFDPVALTWVAIQEGVYLDTMQFLAMIQTADGQQKLSGLNIPFTEVGRAALSGASSNGNLRITMNDVIFFAYSNGQSPRIWATDGITGLYISEPSPGDTANLTGNGLSADFTVDRWSGGSWTSTIANGGGTYSGTGTMNGSNVQFEGAGAGTYGSGTLSGTGAGVVR